MEVFLEEHHISEICRYSGFGTSLPDEASQELIRQAMHEINKAAEPKFVYKEFKEVKFFSGKDIFRHLEGCHTTILLGATIGAGVDAAIRKASYRDISLQLYMDACGSTLIEELCDRVEADLRMKASLRREFLTGRFSPGYGDLPIDCQRDFAAALNTQRMIGLTISGSGVMIPSKSVTAVMGISDRESRGVSGGCATCGIRESCYLRKRGTPCKVRKG